MWTSGKLNGYEFHVKHFEEGSVYGLNEGKISKLTISRDGRILVNYDRGWDILPLGEDVEKIYEYLLNLFN